MKRPTLLTTVVAAFGLWGTVFDEGSPLETPFAP